MKFHKNNDYLITQVIEKWGHLSKRWCGDPGSTKLLALPGWKKKGTRVGLLSGSWNLGRGGFTRKQVRLIFEGSLPSWASSKTLDLIFVLFSFKGSLKLYKLLVFTKAMKEISPVLELLPKAEMKRNTLGFPFCPASDFLLVLLHLAKLSHSQLAWELDQIFSIRFPITYNQTGEGARGDLRADKPGIGISAHPMSLGYPVLGLNGVVLPGKRLAFPLPRCSKRQHCPREYKTQPVSSSQPWRL